jgi:hypothetical protein
MVMAAPKRLVPLRFHGLRAVRTSLAAAALLGCAGAAGAMEGKPLDVDCEMVRGADKLPSASGGAAALCGAITRALAAEAPGVRTRVEVTLGRTATLQAVALLPDGRRLASVGLSVSDAPLSAASFDHLASDLARLVAEAARTGDVTRG